MQWTTEKPTQEGYYWAKESEYDFRPRHVYRVCLVRVGLFTLYGKTRLFAWDDANRRNLYEFSHWMGPLSQPEPPE